MASIDALRGFVMFMMIFVNDLAGAPNAIVPAWMKHFHGKSGMTFVDLVFPGFLFIVGMSIPLALGSRLEKRQPAWRLIGHVLVRTVALLAVGIMMVNETPDTGKMGWSGTLWTALMYLSAILALCSVPPPREPTTRPTTSQSLRGITTSIRCVGWFSLLLLALVFRGGDGHRILSFAPFQIHSEWYGILGLIGWAYLVGSMVYLGFRTQSTALLACVVLLTCLYPADRAGAFKHFWLARYVGIGGTLGSQAAITVAGVLLTVLLTKAENLSVAARTRVTLWFISGFAAAALLVHGLYGIYKNSATPSWCLWSCAITAALWLVFYLVTDVRPTRFVSATLGAAGQNVLLAYLISEMLPSLIDLTGLDAWYSGLASSHLAGAVARSTACAILVLSVSVGLNRLGFRVKL